MSAPISYVCHACGQEAAIQPHFPYRCPGWSSDDAGQPRDHLLTRRLDLAAYHRAASEVGGVLSPESLDEPNPFVAFRSLMASTWLARAHGISDVALVRLIRELDAKVEQVDGHTFRSTPLRSVSGLEPALGLPSGLRLVLKPEALGPSGSHKGRHLQGLMIWLRVLEEAGQLRRRPRLAIASCGNAALAAAVVAKAAEWPLEVFVPPDAEPEVLERLRELDAQVRICERDGVPGDPTYRAFQKAVAEGAFPFGCQGPDNGLTLEGGLTMGYELALQLSAQKLRLDRLILHVGGGALGSAVVQGLREAVRLGVLTQLPRIDAIQTSRVAPFVRAWRLASEWVVAQKGMRTLPGKFLNEDGYLRALHARASLRLEDRCLLGRPSYLALHRDHFMQTWLDVQPSLAHGILDDETYDWVALLEGVLGTRGRAMTVEESQLQQAWEAVREVSDLRPCYTGVAGLAGAMALADEALKIEGREASGTWGVILSGASRDGR